MFAPAAGCLFQTFLRSISTVTNTLQVRLSICPRKYVEICLSNVPVRFFKHFLVVTFFRHPTTNQYFSRTHANLSNISQGCILFLTNLSVGFTDGVGCIVICLKHGFLPSNTGRDSEYEIEYR